MTFEEIIAKLKEIEIRLLEQHPEMSRDRKFQILARSAKVSEEYGELINEVLTLLSLQRSDKLAKFDKANIEKEFGDVFNALILLGMSIDIDVKQAIVTRVKEMHQRYAG